ncbi:hypothetical protein AMJ80_01305 [bacterium SM23_31]|nr:MAG: hypothetical protein AMJ80_01305 [bacterium SM23_31]
MIKFRIHGRGGQGGVTLAKILGFMYWIEGKWVQAFGDYSAERTGAPILAFTLVDDVEITNRSKIYYPDHLIILDPTLISDNILSGLQPGGYLIIDSPYPPEHFNRFPGYRVATINAKKTALKYKLGTKTTPITNTTIAGAMAKVFGKDFSIVEKTIKAINFPEQNISAARDAFSEVKIGDIVPGKLKVIDVVMPSEPIPPLITGNIGTEPLLNTGDWKSEEPFYSEDHIPPCNFNCPAGNNIRGFIEEMTKGNYDGALEILRETTPLPGSTARVCPHPCEDFCNRKDIDEKINIHALERLAADKGKVKPLKPRIERKEKVAIIGSGPAGLSAAYQLRRFGYRPTIYESQPEPGGMMRTGIPAYRLPDDVLNAEIQYIIDSGVEIKCNAPIDSKSSFERLLSEYDAVIIAVGLSFGSDLKLKGATTDNVIQGVDFLWKVNFGEKVSPGLHVIVIGGGNTAIDASRTALRLGAPEVTIVYRRSREEMPAIREEIEAALKEGVKLRFLYSPVHVLHREGKSILQVQKMKLGEPGEDGRRKPIPVPDEYDEIEYTTLILATGQYADLSFLAKDIAIENGFIKTDAFGITSHDKVFAVGDVVSNDGTVTHAVGFGRRVADAVHHYISGAPLPDYAQDKSKITTAQQMNLYYFAPSKRNEIPEAPVEKRTKNFEEVNLGIDTIEEALRCLSCGVCNACATDGISKCVLFCPERTIHKITSTKLEINYEGCKGCLICMEVCPRNAIDKRTIKKEAMAQ